MLQKVFFFLITISLFLSPLYLVRFSFGELRTNALDILLITTCLTGALAIINNYRKGINNVYNTKKSLLFGIFLILSGLVIGLCIHPSLSGLGILKSWFILPITTGFFVAALLNRKQKNSLLWTYFFSTLPVSLISLVAWFNGFVTYDGRLSGIYSSPNMLAMYIAPAIVLGWFMYKGKKNTWTLHRSEGYAFFLALTSALVTLFLTQSIGGIVATLLAIFFGECILWKKKQGNRGGVLSEILFVALILLSLAWVTYQKSEIFFANIERSSLASRVMIWHAAWDIGKDNALLGIGPGNFQKTYLEYQQYYPPYLEWSVPHPHNAFLAFWLSSGITGLLGLLIIITQKIFTFWRNYRENILTIQKIAIHMTILAILLHGLIDTTIWRNDLGLIFWLLLFL